MKHKIIAISVMLLFAWASIEAQTERGRFIFGAAGSVEVSNTKGGLSVSLSKTSSTTIVVKPEVGYFLLDDFSVGISLAMYGYPNSIANDYNDLLSEFKYFFQGTNFRPFVKANIGYKNLTESFRNPTQVGSYSLHGLALGGGVGGAFFVRNNISVDLSLQYLHANLKQVGDPYYDIYTEQKHEFKAKRNDVKVFVGFSVYL